MEENGYPSITNVMPNANGNNDMNNPLLWALLFGNGGFGRGIGAGYGAGVGVGAGVAAPIHYQSESNAREFDSIQRQISGTNAAIAASAEAQSDAAIRKGQSDIQTLFTQLMAAQAVQDCNAVNTLQRQISDCCCGLQTAIGDLKAVTLAGNCSIENKISDQTNLLLSAGTANTQRIIDAIGAQTIGELEQKLAESQRLNQTQVIISEIKKECGGGWPYGATATAAPNVT